MYRHVLVQPRENMVGTVTRSYLLRPEPLSHLVFNFIFDAIASIAPVRWDQTIPRDLSNIRLRTGGQTIIDLPGDQIGYLNAHVWLFLSHSQNRGGDSNTARGAYTYLLPLGRKLYDPNECLPEQTPGNTELTFDLIPQMGGISARLIDIEAVHLPEARPLRHLRYQEQTLDTTEITPNNDMTLPHGNILTGVQIRQSIIPILAGSLGAVDRISILADDNDYQVINSDWYSIWASTPFRQALRFLAEERATENTAAAYVQNAETEGIRSRPGLQSNDPMQYCYLDLDPTRDGQHAIDTQQFRSVKLRLNSGAVGQVRIVPIELVNA